MEEKVEEIILIKDKNGKVKKRHTKLEMLEKENKVLKALLFLSVSIIAILVIVLITYITVNNTK